MPLCRCFVLPLRAFQRLFVRGASCAHQLASMRHRISLAPFLDSGAWDYCLGHLFDVLFRGGFVLSLLALSEHGWGERAVGRLWAVFSAAFLNPLSPAGGFYSFIFLLLRSLLLVFWVFGFYAFAGVKWGWPWSLFSW